MIKTTICTALAILFSLMLQAQSYGEIHGKVIDEKGKPLFDVSVQCNVGANIVGDRTDSLGNFRLKPLAAGEYTVVMRLTGYKEVNISNAEVSADKITRLANTVMNDTIGNLSTIVVIAYKDPLIQVDGGNVVSIRAKELEQMSTSHGGDLKKIATSLTSDIKVSANGEELYFRGSRSGSVIYFIDGVKIRQNVPNVPGSGISSMQVYTGGVPAKYGDTTGGVIVVETKSYLEEYNEKMRQLEAQSK
jgi:hypothetical protein